MTKVTRIKPGSEICWMQNDGGWRRGTVVRFVHRKAGDFYQVSETRTVWHTSPNGFTTADTWTQTVYVMTTQEHWQGS